MPDQTNGNWKPIDGTNGLYEVCDLGFVRRTTPARPIKPSPDGKGYFRVNLSVSGKVRLAYIHALVLEAFVGIRPPMNEARHLDGNPANNRLENLAWGTKSENMQDAICHGTFPLMERRPGAKITRSDAVKIYNDLRKCSVIATEFGILPATVRQIKVGETWHRATGGGIAPGFKARPKPSSDTIKAATDKGKTRAQAMEETGLTLWQIKRLRKMSGLNPSRASQNL